jgi:hypothetical protein
MHQKKALRKQSHLNFFLIHYYLLLPKNRQVFLGKGIVKSEEVISKIDILRQRNVDFWLPMFSSNQRHQICSHAYSCGARKMFPAHDFADIFRPLPHNRPPCFVHRTQSDSMLPTSQSSVDIHTTSNFEVIVLIQHKEKTWRVSSIPFRFWLPKLDLNQRSGQQNSRLASLVRSQHSFLFPLSHSLHPPLAAVVLKPLWLTQHMRLFSDLIRWFISN